MSDLAILGAVLREVGVEEQHGLPPAHRALEDEQPRADPDRPILDRDGDLGGQRLGVARGLPRCGLLGLTARRVEALAEIPRARLTRLTTTSGSCRSAAERTVSPASTPSPPA
jgi:hypothetical protein